MSKRLKIAIALLCAAVCIVSVIHLNRQERIACMVIRHDDKDIPVSFSELAQTAFAGELVDGKGTVTAHTYRGIELKDLLETKGVTVSDLSVTSADNYTAQFTAEEIRTPEKVYAAVEADGAAIKGIDPGTEGVQIIVFGDPNSRRCVRYAAVIEMLP